MAKARPIPAPKPWYVIMTAPGPKGFPGHATVSQKPFPPGATELSGPYATKAEALKAANEPFPPGTPGSGLHIPNPLSGVNAIGDFFSRLTDPNTWARVGEVVIGTIILGIGVYALIKNTETGKSAIRTTKKTAGVATDFVPGLGVAKRVPRAAHTAKRARNVRAARKIGRKI